jgi:hypothetical protein
MSKDPIALLRSCTSCGCVAMMGEAPTAKVALAESLITTLLVIYTFSQANPLRSISVIPD